MSTYGFGFIGCGMIAQFHLKALAEVPGARLVAVADVVPEAAERVAKQVEGCKVYGDYRKMLRNKDVQIVNVCTPSGSHMEPAVAAARRGKHVVVEKPLEITLKRCDRIIEACDKAGVKLCTIFPSRFGDANRILKQAVEAGKFGRLTVADTYVKWWRTQAYYDSGGWRGTWELDGGGALMNQAVHNIDLLTWLAGPVSEVQAFTGCLVHERIAVEDTAVACVKFAGGAMGVIEAATSAYPGLLKRTEIHGDRGSAIVEQDDIVLWKFDPDTPDDEAIRQQFAQRRGGTGGASDPAAISHAGHARQLTDFVQAIAQGRQPLVDGREGRRAVEIILAIYKAAESGKSVKLPLVKDPALKARTEKAGVKVEG